MIEVKNISKSFGKKQVLRDVSIALQRGKMNFIIGQSGSGKTVLLKSIIGLHRVDQGQIIYDGEVYSEMDVKEKRQVRKKIGMVFQGSALFDSATVYENICFPLKMFTRMTRKEQEMRVSFCLDRVNIKNADALYPSEISGGMQKRVAIARAIVLEPSYLFFDEPNSGLDPQTAIIIDELIKELTMDFNTVTVVNTHDMNSIIELGEHIVFIDKGTRGWQGTKDEILYTNNENLNRFLFSTRLLRSLVNKDSAR
ncbi:MAG: ABC transporter ATP-binding protein [Bacteroidia bacterium]|nr:MAG: ABC transporter ATP-binding protein [Bacteroidia bacterium]